MARKRKAKKKESYSTRYRREQLLEARKRQSIDARRKGSGQKTQAMAQKVMQEKREKSAEEEKHRFGSDNVLVADSQSSKSKAESSKSVEAPSNDSVDTPITTDTDLCVLSLDDPNVTEEVGFDEQLDVSAITAVGTEDFYRFRAHVGWLLQGGADDEFARLFHSTAGEFTAERCTAALEPENKDKNRYANVLPYDFNRVRLGDSRFIKETAKTQFKFNKSQEEYINGSYLMGDFNHDDEAQIGIQAAATCPYIATQGPKKETTDDFWRMVWEQNVYSVVMLGKPMEGNMVKFFHYWPDDEILNTDSFQIKPVRTVDHKEYVKRVYIMTRTSEPKQSRVVLHFLFTVFPDHGIPGTTAGFLHLIEMAELESRRRHAKSEFADNTPPPVVVHCSAGLGRTGVYCTIAMSLRKMAAARRDAFSLLDTMLALRRQRAGMMQTRDQLLFCYLTILDRATPLFTNTATVGTPYFHESCDAQTAEKVLSGLPAGSCLFRPSSADGYVSLSIAMQNDETKETSVLHSRVEVQEGGFLLEGQNVLYLSLAEMVVGEESLSNPLNAEQFAKALESSK